MSEWQLEEGAAEPGGLEAAEGDVGRSVAPANLAIFLKTLVVSDTRKWFGEAELRLDVLIVHGAAASVEDLYHPQTLRFPRVKDSDDIASGEHGLLVYLGQPKHFLAMSLMLARDTKDSDDLAALLQAQSKSDDLRKSLSALAGVLPAIPHAGALQAGVGAALALGDVAYKVLRQQTPTCLGLYRAAWLEGRHRFGLGRHPSAGTEVIKDFQLAYEIGVDRRARAAGAPRR